MSAVCLVSMSVIAGLKAVQKGHRWRGGVNGDSHDTGAGKVLTVVSLARNV